MAIMTIKEMKQEHKLLAEYHYEVRPVEKGYANRTLHINLTDNTIEERPVTDRMKDLFTGGRGFCMWLLWQKITPDTKWDDPENPLLIAGGPLGGTTSYPGMGKSTVATVSPLTHSIIDSNAGGYFGPYLKFAGFDALEITGKAEDDDILIVIDGDTGYISIEKAPLEHVAAHKLGPQLTEMYASQTKDAEKRFISVATAGEGAEHTRYACLNLSFYDTRRKEVRVKQAGRGGTGRVFRDKGLKAIVVKYSSMKGDSNNPVNMDLMRRAGTRMNKEVAENDPKQNHMSRNGTTFLVEIMNYFDLLPVNNYQYGSDNRHEQINKAIFLKLFTEGLPDFCWYGCTLACAHTVEHFKLKTGPYAGEEVIIDGPEYETIAGVGSNCGIFDPMAVLEINFYCDTYGIDTISFANCIAFTMECYTRGIIDSKVTDGFEMNWGNIDATLELLHRMAKGEGYAYEMGQGLRHLKKLFVEKYGADEKFLKDIAMEVKGLEISEYMTKESIAQQGGYGMALKGGQHDEAWLIFMDQVNKELPTFEMKAEALHYFPMWRTWFSLHGLCKLPWNDVVPTNNKETDEPQKVFEHVENYTWLFEGLTGIKVTPDDLVGQSERVYNLQRLLMLRLGFGTREHDYMPYRGVGPVTVEEYESRQERYDGQLKSLVEIDPEGLTTEDKMAELRKYREAQYDTLMDAVYKRRGWDKNGIPTLEKVKELGIDLPDVIALIKEKTGQ